MSIMPTMLTWKANTCWRSVHKENILHCIASARPDNDKIFIAVEQVANFDVTQFNEPSSTKDPDG